MRADAFERCTSIPTRAEKTPCLAAAFCFACVILVGRPVSAAGQQEWVVSLLPHYSMVRVSGKSRHGGGLGLAAEYGLTDSWALRTMGSYSTLAVTGSDPGALHSGLLSLSVVYTLDVLRVVPQFMAGMEASFLGGEGVDPSVRMGFHAGFSLDYMLTRYWSIGLELTYHLFVPDIRERPAMLLCGFRFSRRFL